MDVKEEGAILNGSIGDGEHWTSGAAETKFDDPQVTPSVVAQELSKVSLLRPPVATNEEESFSRFIRSSVSLHCLRRILI